jgi:multiple sugar transport system substrate-binding protein
MRKVLSALFVVCLVAGCFRGKPPLPPRESLAEAAQRIDEILKQDRETGREGEAPAEPPQVPNDPNEVVFWYFRHPLLPPAKVGHVKMLPPAQPGQPEIKLTNQFIGEWDHVAIQKMTVSIAAGDVPDIALVKRPFLARLIGSGLIAPLDTVLPAEFIEDFRQPARETLTVNGHLYALPADGFCTVLYYDRNLIPQPPKTWDELRASAQAATRVVGDVRYDVYGIGDYPFLEALWSAGGDVCDEHTCLLNSPQTKEAVDFLLSLDDCQPPYSTDYNPWPAGITSFPLDSVVMTVASSESLDLVLELVPHGTVSVGVAPVPGKTGPVSKLSDNAIVVFTRYAEAKRAAITAALDYLTGPEFRDSKFAGSVPTRTSVAKRVTSPPGFEEAFHAARNTPLVPSWAAIDDVLLLHLDLANRQRMQPKTEIGGANDK